MIKTKKDSTKHEQMLRISAVSKLTGIPTDTIRAWERRYQLISPERDQGSNRQYDSQDVQRLALIKLLIDKGHAISALAPLSMEELNDLLALHKKHTPYVDIQQGPVSVVVTGNVLPVQLRHEDFRNEKINMLGLYSSIKDIDIEPGKRPVDFLIMEYATLGREDIDEIIQASRMINPRKCLVVYGFSNAKNINVLIKEGILLQQAPVKPRVLFELILGHMDDSSIDDYAEIETVDITSLPRQMQYSTEQLAILSSIPNAIKCECPQHLADLILSLTNFEIYSANCENLNEDDAALHSFLKKSTGHARNIIEQALAKVIEAENIKIS